MQHTYYAERKIYNVDSFKNESDFEKNIFEKKPLFLVLSAFQPSQKWLYSWPEKHKDIVKPVQVYYADAQKTQQILVVYKIEYN